MEKVVRNQKAVEFTRHAGEKRGNPQVGLMLGTGKVNNAPSSM
jgi:hypothetical protein